MTIRVGVNGFGRIGRAVARSLSAELSDRRARLASLDRTLKRKQAATGRSQADAPEIDGAVYLRNVRPDLSAGDIVDVLIEDSDAHDLFGAACA